MLKTSMKSNQLEQFSVCSFVVIRWNFFTYLIGGVTDEASGTDRHAVIAPTKS